MRQEHPIDRTYQLESEGVAVHTVLGLSLNANVVAWVLLGVADGTVLDHDALELQANNTEMAGAVARSARSIAMASGFEVDRVRLTWTDDVAHDGLRLRTQLRHLGCGDVETVPMACATAVMVDPEAIGISPRLALAYGAALAVVGPSEPVTVPVAQRARANSRLPRRRFVSGALGVAAAAVLGLLCLSAGAAPQPEPPATATQDSASTDAGWATVPAPSDMATTSVRKVIVAAPPTTEQPTVPAQSFVPVRVLAANAAEPNPAPTGLPHLSGALPAVGPVPEVADPASEPAPVPVPVETEPAAGPGPEPDMTEPAPEPDMTEIVNALSALP